MIAVNLMLLNGASAQFQIGYGLGYFPSGMSRLYIDQAYYQNHNFYEARDGAITLSNNWLPFHHGFTLGYATGGKNKHKADFQMNWSNLHNSVNMERTNKTTNAITSYRRKSRVNSFTFGGKFKTEIKGIESWNLMGVFTKHTLFFKDSKNEWREDRNGDYDFGFDVGVNFQMDRKVTLYLHYTRCFLMFGGYNPSYLGAQLNFKFTKGKKY